MLELHSNSFKTKLQSASTSKNNYNRIAKLTCMWQLPSLCMSFPSSSSLSILFTHSSLCLHYVSLISIPLFDGCSRYDQWKNSETLNLHTCMRGSHIIYGILSTLTQGHSQNWAIISFKCIPTPNETYELTSMATKKDNVNIWYRNSISRI